MGREKYNEYYRGLMAERRAGWKANGLCSMCGAVPRPGLKTCDKCIAGVVANRRRRKATAKKPKRRAKIVRRVGS